MYPMTIGTATAIVAENLVKVYRERSSAPVRALDGMSLEVKSGEVFGLLGRNGAGKTTLLRILTTLVEPTSGLVSVLGFNVQKEPYQVRKNICAVLQENAVELYLSVADNLATYARFHGIPREKARPRIEAAIRQFGLEEYRTQKVIDMSGGTKRRIQVAKAFMVDTPLMFLDEPTTGMDPITKRTTLDALRVESSRGRTVFLTTHILQEAEELCDRIAIIDHGRIVAQGDLRTIKSLASNIVDVSLTFSEVTDRLLEELSALPLLKLTRRHNSFDFSLRGKEQSALDVITRLAASHSIMEVEIRGATLEDAFLELLGRDISGTPGEEPRS
ncbi:MAG: daunorubicin resistance transporter ATPase subunit [Bacteroidetes bacterium]|jgi:ABC-2 type transport system ATP-binding protein|nr:daunorubicin resistance transporter ATPase subunit [Bacteroidota bacterium]